MEQLVQSLKDGNMQLLKVPYPALKRGYVLVKVHYSVISVGTEGKTARDARMGYIGKAKTRKNEVKQVINTAKKQGLLTTYHLVMNKLNAPSSLGYSCTGEVIGCDRTVSEFKIGDKVACAGLSACHAEVVAVPKNLCALVPNEVDLKYAAFSTIAAIAFQSIRRADLRLGESCAIIGLGLLGQFAIQLLKAAGIKTIGVDIEQRQVKLAKQMGAHLALRRSEQHIEDVIKTFTKGFGTDAVIITAETDSLDPVNFAGAICRQKGKVVVVGKVPTGFERKSYYFKELDLRMSMSYGPGRYDTSYEEKGVDYPYAYVRWTENRNMQAYLDLLKDKSINIEKLITHTFDFKHAHEAYKMILARNETFAGILLRYDVAKEVPKGIKFMEREYSNNSNNTVNIGFIGAGSFAQSLLLPAVLKHANMIGITTARSNNSRNVADKFGFQYCTNDPEEIIKDDRISTIFIATRHNLHSEYILKALENNKNVFVEKPLCMNSQELECIKEEYEKRNVHLMVGFNRRFSPLTQKIIKAFGNDQPKAICFRINAGAKPPDHWVNDKEIGGGRIIGDLSHFIDLAMYFAGSDIDNISAVTLATSHNVMDTDIVTLAFQDGGVASISYFSNGNDQLQKEYLEVYYNGQIAVINDFKSCVIYANKVSKTKLNKQNKGIDEEVMQFLASIRNGLPTPISFREVYLSTLASFKVFDAIREQKVAAI